MPFDKLDKKLGRVFHEDNFFSLILEQENYFVNSSQNNPSIQVLTPSLHANNLIFS